MGLSIRLIKKAKTIMEITALPANSFDKKIKTASNMNISG
tara:strand:+ start:1598 stop:1717 length:120 start_codon:yes stop_codon:yes gene_type:complete